MKGTGPDRRDEPKRGEGLSSEEAVRRLERFGPNEIQRGPHVSAAKIFLGQFTSPLIWLLFGACLLSLVLGDIPDAIAISAIVVLNAVVGFLQEFRAERAVAALRSLTAPRARVLRDGRSRLLPALEVVPGDVLVLDAGDIVAADARLIEAHALLTNEAALTGESLPAEKSTVPTPEDAALAERRDFVFLGTHVAAGSGLAEVAATGMRTELGRIAHLLSQTQAGKTPLQERLAQVSRTLLHVCLGMVVVVALVSLARGRDWLEVVLSSVSLAVAAVPEGLPAIVTIALALGVQRMAARNVLVRKLPAIETLGSATVVCTDKTGTLTTGVMRARELWGQDHHKLLAAAAACSDAELHEDGVSGAGDPTEVALLAAAAERGIIRGEIERRAPRREVHPFDSSRKRMSVLRSDGVLYVKGAPESVISCCASGTEGAHDENADMAMQGLRVLAVAVGNSSKEENLRLLGLVGLADPPRTEAIDAVKAAREAGIRTVMITGDHPVTAQAIARELGILRAGDNPADIVHARVSPEDKIRIVRRLKERGEVVAMTGDGVNDAPALREAHVGIAMGKAGTEVAREASSMILTDDNFASIVAAVHEGRGIYDNIRKTMVYLLAGNTSELLAMLFAVLVGLPPLLMPIHLLWINLVTDGLPALALVMDPASADVMKRQPRHPAEPMLGRSEWRLIVLIGLLESSCVLTVFFWKLQTGDVDTARHFAFCFFVFSQMFRAFSARSTTRVFWTTGVFNNLWLLGVIFVTILLQIGVQHVPVTREFLQIGILSAEEVTVALALGLIPVSVLEVTKLVRGALRSRAARRARTPTR